MLGEPAVVVFDELALVVEDGVVHRRTVTVETRRSGRAWLAEGVEDGEVVVVDPPASLTDGTAVETAD